MNKYKKQRFEKAFTHKIITGCPPRLTHIGNSTLTFLLYPLPPAALPLNLNLCGSKSTYDKISLLTKLFLSPFVVLVLRTMLDSPLAIFANHTRVTSPSYKHLRDTSTS